MAFRLPSDLSAPDALVWSAFPAPTTYDEWRAAVSEVKSLNHSQQYKQCVSRCTQLIDTATGPIEPIHKTSLYYYAAVSYVSMSQAAHVYSAAKIPLLNLALENFMAASETWQENLIPPVLNPDQTYSPVEWPESATPSPTTPATPLTFDNSPPPEAPFTSSTLGRVSSVLDTNGQLAQYGILTPPHSVYPSTPPSSSASLATAFVVTPPSIPAISPPSQPSPIRDYSPVSIPAVSHRAEMLSSVSQNFSYPTGSIALPRGVPSPSSVDNELVSFDSSRNGVPIGESLMKNITRMLDSSALNESDDDPFVSKKPFSPKIRRPVHLSPVHFPADLEDPRRQIELVPSPLSVRKVSGEVIKCDRSMIVCGALNKKNRGSEKDICNNFNKLIQNIDSQSRSIQKNYGSDLKRTARARPPRLPLKIIPHPQVNINANQPIPRPLIPERKRVGPVLVMPTPEATPEEKNTSPSSHYSTTLPGSPEQKQWTSYPTASPPCSSVTPTSAARIEVFNSSTNFLREILPKEISWLQEQIDHVKALQLIHRPRSPVAIVPDFSRSRSFWTFSPVRRKVVSAFRGSHPGEGPNIDKFGNVLRVETKVQRIARLRKENWQIGIQAPHSVWKGSEYYEKFREDAIADIEERRGFF
ncbi:hypothetical protein PENARI_c018G02682 [Penicillium arizonense]|uniref:Uncharacterized protein n=1 Tax=Penicillium arizonense TaxID=1835702 RepID=A0A1F5LAB8_PENAI|nr:hypothetical protein PENARI_c018G02682 [Penicillium arizonense]OGE50027.1 hypothetical protein PENARI_c018G02682 [Penicillium arizonense]